MATSGSDRQECPQHFRARLRSIRVDTSVLVTAELKDYYDTEALDQAFGEDRVDAYWEQTKGQGAMHRVGDKLMHRDYHGVVHEATDETLEQVFGGEDADDVV